jgi:hypothetical protein
MPDLTGPRRWRPSPVGIGAGLLVLAGFLLASVNWGFIVLFGLHRVVDDLFARGGVFVLLFFVGPLVVAGLALMRREA